MSYLEAPVMASVMHALTVPKTGGDTLFADLARAYETLTPAVRTAVEHLHAVHSYAASTATCSRCASIAISRPAR